MASAREAQEKFARQIKSFEVARDDALEEVLSKEKELEKSQRLVETLTERNSNLSKELDLVKEEGERRYSLLQKEFEESKTQSLRFAAALRTEFKDATTKVGSLSDERDSLAAQLSQAQTRISNLEEGERALQQEVATLRQENESFRAEVDQFERVNEALREQVQQLKNDLQEERDRVPPLPEQAHVPFEDYEGLPLPEYEEEEFNQVEQNIEEEEEVAVPEPVNTVRL
jgi:chromosome segregation ATPase